MSLKTIINWSLCVVEPRESAYVCRNTKDTNVSTRVCYRLTELFSSAKVSSGCTNNDGWRIDC